MQSIPSCRVSCLEQVLNALIIISEASARCLAMASILPEATIPLGMQDILVWQSQSSCSCPQDAARALLLPLDDWSRADWVYIAGFNTKLSSAGLVYKHFGEEVIAKILDVQEDDPQVKCCLVSPVQQAQS